MTFDTSSLLRFRVEMAASEDSTRVHFAGDIGGYRQPSAAMSGMPRCSGSQDNKIRGNLPTCSQHQLEDMREGESRVSSTLGETSYESRPAVLVRRSNAIAVRRNRRAQMR